MTTTLTYHRLAIPFRYTYLTINVPIPPSIMVFGAFCASSMHILLFFSFITTSLAQNAYSNITLHPIYRTVAPPHGSFPQDPGHIRVVSAVVLVASLIFLTASFTESRRWKSTVPAALTLGATTCVLAEAVNCYLANV